MSATGIPDLTQTAAELSQANARIAAIATEACADCERMQARIQELEMALQTMLTRYATGWNAQDIEAVKARHILAKGTK